MSASTKPKVLIFAPREEPPETISALESLGCEIVVGNRDWQLPRTSHEEDVVAAARDVVGLGRIGTRVAQLLAPWRARLIAYDPYVPPAHFLMHGVTPVDYETLLRQSDVVSFHVVLTRETRYMFGDDQPRRRHRCLRGG